MGLRVSGTCWVCKAKAGPSQAPHGRSPWGLFLSQGPAHGEPFSSFPRPCSRPESPLDPLGVLGAESPPQPSVGDTHTRDVSIALRGQFSKPGPMHGSNNWEGAVAPAFPSPVHFTPTIQIPSFLVEGKPWSYCQWTRFCSVPGSGKGLLTDSGVTWAPSLPIPSPALGALCPCTFSLHRARRGRQGGSLLTQEEALHSPTLCSPALLTPSIHTDSPQTDSSHTDSAPSYSAPSDSAHTDSTPTHSTSTHSTPTYSTTTDSAPNIPLSPCPPPIQSALGPAF